MYDKRLIGTWHSDKKRTAQEIEARRDISHKHRERLLRLFGKLSVRYTRTKCYTTFDGSTDVSPLRIAAKDAGGVVVLGRAPLIGGDLIYHIRFEDRPKGGPSSVSTSAEQLVEGTDRAFDGLRAGKPTVIADGPVRANCGPQALARRSRRARSVTC